MKNKASKAIVINIKNKASKVIVINMKNKASKAIVINMKNIWQYGELDSNYPTITN